MAGVLTLFQKYRNPFFEVLRSSSGGVVGNGFLGFIFNNIATVSGSTIKGGYLFYVFPLLPPIEIYWLCVLIACIVFSLSGTVRRTISNLLILWFLSYLTLPRHLMVAFLIPIPNPTIMYPSQLPSALLWLKGFYTSFYNWFNPLFQTFLSWRIALFPIPLGVVLINIILTIIVSVFVSYPICFVFMKTRVTERLRNLLKSLQGIRPTVSVQKIEPIRFLLSSHFLSYASIIILVLGFVLVLSGPRITTINLAEQEQVDVPSNRLSVASFNLTKGWTVTGTLECSSGNITFYAMESPEYIKFSQNKSFSPVYSAPNIAFSAKTSQKYFSFNVRQEGRHYFVFLNLKTQTTSMKLSINLKFVDYNLPTVALFLLLPSGTVGLVLLKTGKRNKTSY